jgi:hypothetical protein
LLGGEQGRELVEEADAFMARREVVDPARLTATMLPGFEQ